ncbi:eye-specific diacylglycerol kinase [Drosophila madeirensis]|uniref:Eye-specific diacylglycerol kinase n=1 Tax=Drosophila madeirensis TaxID=30013 RepID=A0AAU9G0R8_DROMD
MPERRVSQRDVDEIEIESDEEEENLEQGVGLSVQSTRHRRHSPMATSRDGRVIGKVPNGNHKERSLDRFRDDSEEAIFEDHDPENDDDELDDGEIELLD